MKTTHLKTLALAAAVAGSAAVAPGQMVTNTIVGGAGGAIPDNNLTGLVSSTTVSGISGPISSVSVTLDITGGFNGDYYAYLTDPSGAFCVLLNRVGVGSGNAFGYSDAGLNITLSDAGNDIHNYKSPSDGATYSAGQLTGITWAPDGRTIDPQSVDSAFDTAPRTTSLSNYAGDSADGAWNLFIADVSPGGQGTLVNWGLSIVTVPEPQTWALAAGGVGMLAAFGRRRKP